MTAKKRTQKADKSPYVYQNKKQELGFSVESKIPWTEKQLEFLRLIQDKQCKIIFVSGPAGTSKTILAVYAGLLGLKEKKFSDIVYVRSVIESASQKMGFLPGDQNEKISVYLEPLMDKLEEIVGKENTNNLVAKNLVSGRPINYLRGCQFSGKFVIGDEFQNVTVPEMTTFMTRIGEFSKVIICGDPMQSDIGKASAFKKYFDLFNDENSRENGIFTFEFLEEDIVRSEIVKFIVKKLKEL